MLRYIIIRIIWIFIVLAAVLTMLFVVFRLTEKKPAELLDKNQQGIYYEKQVYDGYMTKRTITDEEEAERIRRECYRCGVVQRENEIKFDIYEPVPIPTQYVSWAKNIITKWDWGYSNRVRINEPVFNIISERVPVTMQLNIFALCIYLPLGLIIGIIAALNKDKMIDNVISLGVMIFISIPNFVLLFLLLILFAYQLDWVPTQFYNETITGPEFYTGFILPVMALSFGSIASLTRLTRAELTEVLTSDFLLLARTKGLTRRQAVVRHALRNSMVPLVPWVIGAFVSLISGSVITEQIYGIPGMGTLYISALNPTKFDHNLILAILFIYTSISLVAVLLVDLSYGIVDPRIRMGARK